MKLTELYRIVKKRLTEAELDIDKFARKLPGDPGHKSPSGPRASQGQDLGDIARAAGHEPAAQEKKVSFYKLMPAPKEGAGGMQRETALKLKLHATKSAYISPEHWEPAEKSDGDSVQLDGPDYVKAKTPVAKKVGSMCRLKKMSLLKAGSRADIWKKDFEQETGIKFGQD